MKQIILLWLFMLLGKIAHCQQPKPFDTLATITQVKMLVLADMMLYFQISNDEALMQIKKRVFENTKAAITPNPLFNDCIFVTIELQYPPNDPPEYYVIAITDYDDNLSKNYYRLSGFSENDFIFFMEAVQTSHPDIQPQALLKKYQNELRLPHVDIKCLITAWKKPQKGQYYPCLACNVKNTYLMFTNPTFKNERYMRKWTKKGTEFLYQMGGFATHPKDYWYELAPKIE